jgi:hypothetical protein
MFRIDSIFLSVGTKKSNRCLSVFYRRGELVAGGEAIAHRSRHVTSFRELCRQAKVALPVSSSKASAMNEKYGW